MLNQAERAPIAVTKFDRALSLRFSGFFLLWYISLNLMASTPWAQQFVDSISGADAQVVSLLLRCLGRNARADGAFVVSAHFALAIAPECSASDFVCLLAAGMFAFPTSVALKIAGVLCSIVAIGAINFARVISLFLIGERGIGWFKLESPRSTPRLQAGPRRHPTTLELRQKGSGGG